MAGQETERRGLCLSGCYAPCGHALKSKSVLVATHAVFLALLLFCTHSWGACQSSTSDYYSYSLGRVTCYYGQSCGVGDVPKCSSTNACVSCPSTYSANGYFYADGRNSNASSAWCLDVNSSCGSTSPLSYCRYYTRCTSQAEADSVKCELNPSAPGCVVLQDTSIFVCNESFEYNYQTGQEKQPYMQLYRCDCKWDATNHTGTCNGKTNVNPKTDCELVMNIPGTCNQNGYQQGPNTDTTGSSATCYAIVGDKCYMRDNRSGNTFTCGCDGNCNYAYEQMNRGLCENPYFSSASQDSTFDPFSSSSFPSSSGSEGGEGGETSSSSGEGGEGTSGSSAGDSIDFEYDYTSILEAIQANTQGTMNNTQNIDANFIQVNTNINNVTNAVNSASSNIAGAVNNASSNIGGKLNTLIGDFGEFTTLWASYKDSMLHPQGDVAFDSGYHNDSVGMFRDSISRHMHDIDSILDAMGDTTTNYIVFDSIYDWNDTASIKDKLGGFFFNAPASNSCPVFNLQVNDMPIMGDMDWSIDFGNFFGRLDFCSLIRALVRLGTLIAIVLGTIQAFRKAFSNGG